MNRIQIKGINRKQIGVIKKSNSLTGFKPSYQLARMKWKFYQYDQDPFPSIPHGHSIDNRYKLHVGNGKIYKGSTIWGEVKKKDLARLRNDEKFKELAKQTIQYHKEIKESKVNKVSNKKIFMKHSTVKFFFESDIEQYK